MTIYDAIVVGAGGIGSAALWRLARRGAAVLGIDSRRPPHDRGSSHGETRIIRQAYFEHPDYVPLAQRSFALWSELEEATGRQLYRQTGLLQIGPASGDVLRGVERSAAMHGLPLERLTPDEIRKRWPVLAVDEDWIGAFELCAGYLAVEECVSAQWEAALAAGAGQALDEEVVGWDLADPIVVRGRRGEYRTRRLVIAAGPWAAQLLQGYGLSLTVLRKTLHWFHRESAPVRPDDGFPCFLYETDQGVFYGFPSVDGRTLKAAEHSGGATVDVVDDASREVDASDWEPTGRFLQRYLPQLGQCVRGAVCFYTMSDDGHFCVGPLPNDARVCVAAGMSGHGFKFAPVLGEALAQLTLDGRTDLPIGFLSPDRFSQK
ncbi:MAG: N-methyl-L-tryptophan oxidase [Planctomycetales bacterium]|nr:N-methyl-L-tryptophan oxidase [Planctomycetales bacterium]